LNDDSTACLGTGHLPIYLEKEAPGLAGRTDVWSRNDCFLPEVLVRPPESFLAAHPEWAVLGHPAHHMTIHTEEDNY